MDRRQIQIGMVNTHRQRCQEQSKGCNPEKATDSAKNADAVFTKPLSKALQKYREKSRRRNDNGM
jgi:hypothetical protein